MEEINFKKTPTDLSLYYDNNPLEKKQFPKFLEVYINENLLDTSH